VQNVNTPQNNSASWDLQMGFISAFNGLSSICYPSDQARRTSLTVVTCRSDKQVPLKHPYVSTNITLSFGRRQQSALQLFGFTNKAPATVISVTVPCIIVCSGSRTSKESLSVICWCGVEMWIGTGVTKTFVLLLNNLKGIKKHVEDILVDAVLGSKFCSVIVIYDTKYYINNFIIWLQ